MWTTDLHLLLLVAAANGFFTPANIRGCRSGCRSYSTRMRATGMAFAFNAPRFIAFMGPLAGMLIAQFGGFSKMAGVLVYLHSGFCRVPVYRGKGALGLRPV
jgi:hypothetical protein